jgi:hypothetical protein
MLVVLGVVACLFLLHRMSHLVAQRIPLGLAGSQPEG